RPIKRRSLTDWQLNQNGAFRMTKFVGAGVTFLTMRVPFDSSSRCAARLSTLPDVPFSARAARRVRRRMPASAGTARRTAAAGLGDVHLKTDAVDWDPFRQQVLQQRVDAVRFRAQALAAIVVVEEERLSVGGARQSKGVGDVFIAEPLAKQRVPEGHAVVGD